MEGFRVEDPEEIEKAWAEEIERRARRVLNGQSEGAPWEAVLERVQRRLRAADALERGFSERTRRKLTS